MGGRWVEVQQQKQQQVRYDTSGDQGAIDGGGEETREGGGVAWGGRECPAEMSTEG